MNILFLTLTNFNSIDERGIYTDLLREIARKQNMVYVVSPVERRMKEKTRLIKTENAVILKVKTGNIQKTNLIEKGISTVLLETQYISAIKKYFADVKFDFILYATPPITFAKSVEFVKKRDNAKTYLMLKDIFPQNAVDIGMMKKSGLKGILYRYFRKKEKRLYAISDKIGCMSQANVDYILKHNPEVPKEKVEICPNSIEMQDVSVSDEERVGIREKYSIPLDKKVFVYGGNLGKPQGIPHIINCLRAQKSERAYFLIIGDGTEYKKLEDYINEEKPENVRLMRKLPKEDYDKLVVGCDVGMIFLDHRFTIPNFPSRLLAYMQAGLPVLACTDANTDVGKVIEEGGFGFFCESNDTDAFVHMVDKALSSDLKGLGENGKKYLEENYTVAGQCEIIMRSISEITE